MLSVSSIRGRYGGQPSRMKSLFVISLPRSLSTTIYYASQRTLGLERPAWTSAGEILNHDRVWLFRRRRLGKAKFATREHEPVMFERLTGFLNEMTVTEGLAYKDVVNPFVMASWPDLSEFSVLKIRRDLAEVAFAILTKGWRYPRFASSDRLDVEASIIQGLMRAETALAAIPGETVEFADAIVDHAPLQDALHALYPGSPLPRVNYIDEKFARGRRVRQRIQAESKYFPELSDLVDSARADLLKAPLDSIAPSNHTQPETPARTPQLTTLTPSYQTDNLTGTA